MGVNSIRAEKLLANVPRTLNKRTFISGQFYVSVVAIYFYLMDICNILFSPIFLNCSNVL